MKKLLSAILSTTLVLASFVTAFATDVKIDNQNVNFTAESGQPFVDAENRTQVPFRQTMEAFGATVEWNQQTQTAIAEKNGIKIEIPIGTKYVIKNGAKITNDTAALVKDGRTYLPIRVVLEAFGANVKWDNATQAVIVSTTNTAGEDMTIHFINVGQGDSILVDKGDDEILIDAGPKSAASAVSNYIKPYIQGALDVVVATHEHEDHIGGLPMVLANYTVDKVIDNGRSVDTNIYAEYIAAVNAEGCQRLISSEIQNITAVLGDDATFRAMATTGNYSDSNNNSIISLLEYGTVKILLTGDAEQPVEQQNLSAFPDVDILKAGHHGSKTSSSAEFLSKTRPETVIVSAATGNIYKHPNLAAMQRFQDAGAKVYGTFRSGNIVATTNGNTYSLNTSTVISTADAGDGSESVTPPVTTPPITETAPPANNDGVRTEAYYIGNVNSKIFHSPDCGSIKQMSEKNKVSLQTRADAVSKGYTPCKNCKP